MSAVIGRLLGKKGRAEAIAAGYQAGDTLRQLGDLFGLSWVRVRSILQDCGVPLRSPGRPPKTKS